MAVANDEQPITKSDLRYELSHYASKADLAQMETRLILRLGGLFVIVAALATLIDRLIG